MTTQDIIRQSKSFTIEQKQELAYYFLLSTISEEKRKEFANMLQYKDNISEKEHSSLLSSFSDWKNQLPADLIINDDEFYN